MNLVKATETQRTEYLNALRAKWIETRLEQDRQEFRTARKEVQDIEAAEVQAMLDNH